MSLIANCQSDKASCCQDSFRKVCENNQFPTNQYYNHFKEFNRFFSNSLFKSKQNKLSSFKDIPLKDLYTFEVLAFERNFDLKYVSSTIFLKYKISKIRNKDYLELSV